MSRKNWSSEKLFFRLLNNKTNKTYWANVSELRKRPSEEVYEQAFELAQSAIDKEITLGVDVLAQLGVAKRYNQAKTVELYFDLLKVPQSPNVLYTILSAIGHNNASLTKRHISKLAEFKDHNYSDVRFGLVFALSCVDLEIAIELLIELMNDKHPDVRDYATFSIGTQSEMNTPEIIEALKARLDDSHRMPRVEAIIGLALRKDPSVKEILIDELKDIDDHGSFILESIKALEDADFIPLINKQITKNKVTQQVNEKWLISTLKALRK